MQVNSNWPGAAARNFDKAPSRFALALENASLDSDSLGHSRPPEAKTYSWFKLRLDNAEKSKYDSEELRGVLKKGLRELPRGITAQELTTAYLRGLHEHFQQVMRQRFGTALVNTTTMDVWLTVPATWENRAKNAKRTAAKDAGFAGGASDSLNIITEPEAAASHEKLVQVRFDLTLMLPLLTFNSLENMLLSWNLISPHEHGLHM